MTTWIATYEGQCCEQSCIGYLDGDMILHGLDYTNAARIVAEHNANVRDVVDKVVSPLQDQIARLTLANDTLMAVLSDLYSSHEGETCGRVHCCRSGSGVRL